MPKELLVQVAPEVAGDETLLKAHLSKLVGVTAKEIVHVAILKRSIDARQKAIKINLKVSVFFEGDPFVAQKIALPDYKNVSQAQEVIVIGIGVI